MLGINHEYFCEVTVLKFSILMILSNNFNVRFQPYDTDEEKICYFPFYIYIYLETTIM